MNNKQVTDNMCNNTEENNLKVITKRQQLVGPKPGMEKT